MSDAQRRLSWHPDDLRTLRKRDRPGKAETASGTQLLHGTPGRPSYRKYHPQGGSDRAKATLPSGGRIGSDRYTEKEHRDTVRHYTRTSEDYNEWLRNGTTPGGSSVDEARARNSVLNDLISIQEPSKEEKTYWRGTKDTLPPMQVGDEFHDRGFTSVTDSKWVAETVFSQRGGGIVSIKAGPGTQALNLKSIGETDIEEESILSPGTRYRVIGIIDAAPPRPTGYQLEIIND